MYLAKGLLRKRHSPRLPPLVLRLPIHHTGCPTQPEHSPEIYPSCRPSCPFRFSCRAFSCWSALPLSFELNRIYPVRALQEAQAFEIHIRERQRPNTLFKPADMGYTVAIRRNGTVEYRDEEQQVVIVDTFASIKVQERRADVIANALELAKLRYGVNGFEIRNATQQDLAAIEAAVRATGTSVKVLPKEPAKERDDGHER